MLFPQFRGKRLSIGMPGTVLRLLVLEVLNHDALAASTNSSIPITHRQSTH